MAAKLSPRSIERVWRSLNFYGQQDLENAFFQIEKPRRVSFPNYQESQTIAVLRMIHLGLMKRFSSSFSFSSLIFGKVLHFFCFQLSYFGEPA